MFLAHLPAGYLLTRGLLALPGVSGLSAEARSRLMTTGLVASVLPDFDLFYYYLVSTQGLSHRAFPTHWPLLWLALFFVAASLLLRLRRVEWQWHNLFLLANVQLHFFLDTVAGPIRWLAPFEQTRFTMMHVPRQPGWWVWSYAVHVSALIEIAIITAAALLLGWTARRQKLARSLSTIHQGV